MTKTPPDTTISACNRILDRAAEKLQRLLKEDPELWPFYTQEGSWVRGGETWTEWCQGFLPGQLWLLYDHTDEPFFREQAIAKCQALVGRADDPHVHDHGFLFRSSWLRWFHHDGDEKLLEPVITGGRTLAKRARGNGRYLCSFMGDSSLFIDIMMNVGITIFAANRLGDEDLLETAMTHCRTTQRYLVRGDGSTIHEGIFNPATGEFLRPSTQQGWRADSCWARGQAWSFYGFADVFRQTNDPDMLLAAIDGAEYFLDQMAGRVVPPNDFDQPGGGPLDSSAAAIGASGLLELADQVAPDVGEAYQEMAWFILEGLAEDEFLSPAGPLPEGVLKHGVYHPNKGLGVDECVAWGDYFLLEACRRVTGGAGQGGEKS